MAGEPELDEALEKVAEGATSINLNGMGYMDDKLVTRVTAAVVDRDVPVEWDYFFAQREGDDFNRTEGEEADEHEYGSAVSQMPNVLTFTIKLNRYGRYAYAGLTSNPDDPMNFPGGFGVRMSPSGLGRATGLAFENPELNPMEDLIQLSVVRKEDGSRHIEARKNGALIEVLGPAPAGYVTLYAKIFMREADLLVRLVETKTISKVASIEMNLNKIADKGASNLAEALETDTTLVTYLDLSLNRIESVGATRLAQALRLGRCQIVTLNLSHNSISDKGCRSLAEAFETECCLVTYADLTDNDIGDEGAIRMGEAIGKETCFLTTLKIGLNRIESAGIMSIAEALELPTCKITTIDLGHNKPERQARKRLAKSYANTLRLDVA
mmetsp:Transcript_12919/g.29328  ORF Transcript_12919/g.29328 Transcript_12919/m.29328 type:complete len:383 (+) Transcript_12919:112-1260(+)|eukprot:CAMPEP_0197908826 /NCGR_PEP_ID=MMETSP1439-20131203/67560_1 /TAXON_ID=66791 /ORGANISM="Gonyaulax spinifera, Strain CCMP409" /LENGTH=382 /DNA_ID=CAMNT_0043530349 /DNA_START=106 /DNA_END=1254 /DNA_ORIENTATION=+